MPADEVESKRVPLTLICGFLGAGKSKAHSHLVEEGLPPHECADTALEAFVLVCLTVKALDSAVL